MRLDFHTHSKYSSDSDLELGVMISFAKKAGLGGLVITDHDSMEAAKHLEKTDDFLVLVGEEIATDRGHVIGLFITEEIKPGLLEEVIDKTRAQGGIVVASHPFDLLRGTSVSPSDKMARLFDAVECFNARCILNRFNVEAQKYAEKHRLPKTAGSDAHTYSEIGSGSTEVEGNTPEEIRDALLKGKTRLFGKTSKLEILGRHLATASTRMKRKIRGSFPGKK